MDASVERHRQSCFMSLSLNYHFILVHVWNIIGVSMGSNNLHYRILYGGRCQFSQQQCPNRSIFLTADVLSFSNSWLSSPSLCLKLVNRRRSTSPLLLGSEFACGAWINVHSSAVVAYSDVF
jgi:hypothetical protein